MLAAVGGKPPAIELTPVGFDVRSDALVQMDGNSTLLLVSPDRTERQVALAGLYYASRPSFSPDGERVVLQASESADLPPREIHVYIVSTRTGNWTRLSAAEGGAWPEWSPSGDLIAYGASDGTLFSLRVVDPSGDELFTVPGEGLGPFAFSPDGTRVLHAVSLRIIDVASGEVVAELFDEAFAGVEAAGYELGWRIPINGDFSPEGDALVFDGAVEKDGVDSTLVMTIRLDGTGFEIVAGPFASDPTRGIVSSDPMWR